MAYQIATKPFVSRRQQRWAHATHQKFARRWDKETPDFAALPEKKDAGTDAGAPLHGPGGLLGTPGIRSQRRARRAVSVTTKPMSRSEAARVAALARWGKYTPKQKPPKRLGGAAVAPYKPVKITPLKGGPKGGKGRRAGKPKQGTDAERAATRQAKRDEREQQRATEQEQNRKAVDKALGLPEDAAGALDDLRAGTAVDDDGGLVKLGLAEQARDGTYRLTPAGRALDEARKAGDAGRARDIMSRARDTLTARGERQAATAARRQATAARRAAAAAERERRRAKPAGGGGRKKQPPKPRSMSAARRRRLERARQRIADAAWRSRMPTKPPQADKLSGRIVQTTKAQTAQERAIHAKLSGGKGSGGGGGSSASAWKKGPDGKRHPSAAQVDAMQSKLDTRKDRFEKNPPKDRVAKVRESSRIRQQQEKIDDHKERAVHALDRLDHGIRDKRNEVRDRLRRAKPGTDEQRYLSNYLRDLNDSIADVKRNRHELAAAGKSFTVYKSADGTHRWLARSTTAYRDRDREILPIAALDADSQRMTASRQFGPLRWWHVGQPDPLNTAAPWGPGLDIGDCDFSTQIGTTRVESGTFRDPQVAQRIAANADQYELSPGFFHTYGPSGPPDGIYRAVRTFERSLVPTRYGRASNLFTGLTVKEHRMDPNEMERRFKAAIAELGLSQEQAQSLAAGLVATDKSAADQGIAFKSDDAPQVFTAPDGTQGIIHEGRFVALKAMPPEFAADEEKADGMEMGAPMDEEAAEMMDDPTFIAAIADAVVAKIAPMFGDMKMSEFKTLLGGMATKEAGTQAEITALKARLAQLEGHQPAVVTNEALAALKSTGPQPPPDGSEPQIPADATPVQRLAIQTMPSLYQNDPSGQFRGWAPPTLPPTQS